jgi:DNA polymerase III epsilon subunit-like protein
MFFIFDTETLGLPIFNTTGYHRFPSFKYLNKYDTARIVSISWILAEEDGTVIKQAYHIIRPLDFMIDNNSKAVEIHGITSEIADEKGIPWHTMYDELIVDLNQATTIVAHNIQFDVSILLSEMYRYNKQRGITSLLEKNRLCTMKMGMTVMKQKKRPKLIELYKHLYNEEMQNAHDAEYDTKYCHKCLVAMMDKCDVNEFITTSISK